MTAPPLAQPLPLEGMAQVLIELGKISTQIAVMDERVKAIPDHETRLRRLEEARAKIIGGAVAVSALVSGLGTWIGFVLTRR